MKTTTKIGKPALSAWMRVKLAMLWAAALVAPGVAVPASKRVRDSAPVPIVHNEFEDDVDFDDEYQGEPFYRGLPIFDKDGNRSTLLPGKEYVEGQLQLSNGLIMQCWRERGHKPVVIDTAKIPAGQ